MLNFLPQPVRVLIGALMVVYAGLLVFGFAFGELSPDRANRLPKPARMLMSVILVIVAFLLWEAGSAGTELDTYGLLIALGMTFGLLGDLILADYVPALKGVVFGIIAFGIGHVLYIAGYLRLSAVLGLSDVRVRWVSLGIGLVVGLVAWFLLARTTDGDPILNYGSLGYALLLGGMVAMAASVAAQDGRFVPMAIGAALFMLSDMILANRLFHDNVWYLVGDVVWVTYTIGQALIVFSVAVAVEALQGT